MNAGARLAAYGLALLAVAGGGAALGSAVGPIAVDSGADGHRSGHVARADGGASSDPTAAVGGLLVAQDGYTLHVEDRVLDAGRPNPLSFTIVGPDGPLQDYATLHDRELHLIVVSRDLQRFAHLHPSRDEAGVWSVELPALEAGVYRAYADFEPAGGDRLTLGVDLTVPGPLATPEPLVERRVSEVGGYEVTLDGRPEAGTRSQVTVTVRRDGEVVTTEPYLGAAGHLVAIRDGDLAYLHVHPLDDDPAGPVRFRLDAPSPGTYRLFFDFAHAGTVRTAAFTVSVDDTDVAGVDAADHGTAEPDHQGGRP